MTTTWQVTLDYATNLGPSTDQLVDTLIELSEDLEQYDPAVGQHEGGLSVTLAIDADDALSALRLAGEAVTTAAKQRDIEPGPLAGSRAVTWERAEAELDEPNYPDIVSAVEAADILHVSRQRVHQLWKDNPRFPTPLYELRTGPLWVRAGIEKFDREWERKPGRPSKPSKHEQSAAIRAWAKNQGMAVRDTDRRAAIGQ